MALRKIMKSQPSEMLAAKGLLYQDWEALTECQRECTARLGMGIQMEQESYLLQHPEISALLRLFISEKSLNALKKKSEILKEAAQFFLRSPEEIDENIRKLLLVEEKESFTRKDKPIYQYTDKNIQKDLREIIERHQTQDAWNPASSESASTETQSSSFLSMITSDTTLPTPEPIPTPEPTLSMTMLALVSNTIDKAVYSRVDDETLLYDTAYVELMNAVEAAMEIPVYEIKEDLYELFFNALNAFEINITEKERIAAEIAWDKRMRKKMKRTLRRGANFKGYETPETPKSEISSHESYRKAPPKPCECHPQWHYNRYQKDRFGIYLPFSNEYQQVSITVTPAVSFEDLPNNDESSKKGGTNFVCSSRSSQKLTAKSSSAAMKASKRT